MTESEVREILKKECLEYQTNFRGMDGLYRMEDNYHTACSDRYDFSGCPQSYNVFEDAPELCSVDNFTQHPPNECLLCWKRAFEWAMKK